MVASSASSSDWGVRQVVEEAGEGEASSVVGLSWGVAGRVSRARAETGVGKNTGGTEPWRAVGGGGTEDEDEDEEARDIEGARGRRRWGETGGVRGASV